MFSLDMSRDKFLQLFHRVTFILFCGGGIILNRTNLIFISIIFILSICLAVSITYSLTKGSSKEVVIQPVSTKGNITATAAPNAKSTKPVNGEKKTSIEKIKDEQNAKVVPDKEAKNSMASKILENMKKKSQEDIKNVAELPTKIPSSDKPDNRTFEEKMDDSTTYLATSAWSGFFNFLYTLQRVSIPASMVVFILGVILSLVFYKDKPKLKWAIAITIGGPALFLLINYLPAFYWYLIS